MRALRARFFTADGTRVEALDLLSLTRVAAVGRCSGVLDSCYGCGKAAPSTLDLDRGIIRAIAATVYSDIHWLALSAQAVLDCRETACRRSFTMYSFIPV